MLIASCEGTRMEPVSAGMHMAVCCAVIDLGLRKQVFKEQERISRKVLLMWELPDETFEDKDGNTQPRTMSKQYTLSLHEKAGLTKMLQSWRGKPFTAEELIDLERQSFLVRLFDYLKRSSIKRRSTREIQHF